MQQHCMLAAAISPALLAESTCTIERTNMKSRTNVWTHARPSCADDCRPGLLSLHSHFPAATAGYSMSHSPDRVQDPVAAVHPEAPHVACTCLRNWLHSLLCRARCWQLERCSSRVERWTQWWWAGHNKLQCIRYCQQRHVSAAVFVECLF